MAEARRRRPGDIQPPDFAGRTFAHAIDGSYLLGGERYSDLDLDAPDLGTTRATKVTLEAVRLRRGSFAGAALPEVRLTDVLGEGTDLSNLDAFRADLLRVEFRTCRLTGFRANEARIEHLVVHSCHAAYAQFRFARFKHTRFDECDLHEADFAGSDLSRVVFHACDLREADFSGAKLAGTDLRGSKLEGLKVEAAQLAGAIMTPVQVVELARQLGIVVKWEHE